MWNVPRIRRTVFLLIALGANVAAIVIWATRPPLITSGFLAVGSADDAPIRIFAAWLRGGQAPRTPLGLVSVFETMDVVIAAALGFIATVTGALLAMTWTGNSSRALARLQSRLSWPPSFTLGVRGAMLAIAILGLELGWEVNGWTVWRRREAQYQKLYLFSGGATVYRNRATMIREYIDDAYVPAGTQTNAARTPEAVATERAAFRDRAKSELAYAESMADAFAELAQKYEHVDSGATSAFGPAAGLSRRAPDVRLWLGQRQYRRALDAIEHEIVRDPELWDAHSQRAWILATCPDHKIRNGRAAVQSALRACELTNWRHAQTLDTLAAAYAETGDFQAAVDSEKSALKLIAPHSSMETTGTARLALYEARKPYREAGKTNRAEN